MTALSATGIDFGASRPTWRRAAIFGFLGSVTLIALEFLVLPQDMTRAERGALALFILIQWSVAGTLIAYVAMQAEHRFPLPVLIATLLALAVLLSAAFAVIFALAFAYGAQYAVVRNVALAIGFPVEPGGFPRMPLPTFLYNLWILLFFGGMFTTACVLRTRSEGTRDALARAEIERGRLEAALGDAELESLRAHVDPAFLLRVVTEIERRYEAHPVEADQIQEALVVFLRLAMPGVRGGGTTLQDELRLAASYGRVWAEIDPRRARWRIRADAPMPRAPFPSLWLLPVLDSWANAAESWSLCDVRVDVADGVVTLMVDGPATELGTWLAPQLDFQLRVGLRTLFGDAATLTLQHAMAPSLPALSLAFPLPAGARKIALEPADAGRIS